MAVSDSNVKPNPRRHTRFLLESGKTALESVFADCHRASACRASVMDASPRKSHAILEGSTADQPNALLRDKGRI